MKRDYYEVLGIERSATLDEIKRAYKRQAIAHHPDRNPDDPTAEDRFKEASEAYAVLSDDSKRARYDRLGHGAFDATTGGFDAVDLGSMAEVLEGIFGDVFSGRRRRRVGRDVTLDLSLTFVEAATGVSKTVEVTRPTSCETCAGTGGEPGTPIEMCTACRGKGAVRYQRGFFAAARECQACRGTGRRVTTPCKACSGSGSAAWRAFR